MGRRCSLVVHRIIGGGREPFLAGPMRHNAGRVEDLA